jgi:tetratricopeptide (TPR) repeat protein
MSKNLKHMKLKVWIFSLAGSLASALTWAIGPEFVDQGLAAFDQGSYQEAETIFLKQIDNAEHNNQALIYLSWLQLNQGKTESARDYIERALKVSPNTADELTLSGDIYCGQAQQASMFAALKMAKKCLAQYEAAVELEPENVEALFSAMQFYFGAPSFAGGSVEKGNALLEKLKTISPEHATTYQIAELDKAKKTEAAVALADELAKKGFSSAINQYQVAHFYRNKKYYEKALPLFASMNSFQQLSRIVGLFRIVCCSKEKF